MLKFLKQEKSFYKMLLAIAVPAAFSQLINQAIPLTDTFMLGMLGEVEISAATIANVPFFVLSLMIFGFQSGSSMLTSQYWGSGNTRAINKIMGVCLYICTGLTLIISLVFTFFPAQVIALCTNIPSISAIAQEYLQIVAFSYLLNAISLIYISTQRSMENVKIGLAIQIVCVLVNVVLNYILIFGVFGAPKMGVLGAAWSTVFSRVLELVLVVIFALNSKFKLDFKAIFQPGKAIFADFFRYSSVVVLSETLWALGVAVFPSVFGRLDEISLAAYTIVGNIDRVMFSIAMGISTAAGVIIGKRIGEGQTREQVYSQGGALLVLSVFAGLVCIVLLLALSPLIFPVLKLEPQTMDIARDMIIISACAVVARAFNSTGIVGVLRSGGDTKIVLALDFIGLHCLTIPLVLLAAFVWNAPPVIVYLFVSLEEPFKFGGVLYRFKSKKWIKNLTRAEV